MSERRRFPPPWSVTDANGAKLGYFYYSDRPDTANEGLSRGEAYAMAVNFARLPDLLTSLKRG